MLQVFQPHAPVEVHPLQSPNLHKLQGSMSGGTCTDCGRPAGRYSLCFKCQLGKARTEGYELGYQTGYLAGEQAKAKEKDTEITRERFDRLRRLCHPDKHGNSPASVEISQWLNDKVSKMFQE